MKTLLRKLWLPVVVAILVGGAAHEYVYGADLPIYTKNPVREQGIPQAFTGWYVGAFVGYGQSDGTASLDRYSCPECSERKLERLNDPSNLGAGPDLRRDGLVIGGHVGYDWAVADRVRLGLFGDVAWSGIRGSAQGNYGHTQMISELTWYGSVNARAVYMLTPGAMVYGTGGLSVGGLKTSISGIGSPGGCVGDVCSEQNQGSSDTKVGWNLGAGFESYVDAKREWSVGIDWRHIWFPRTSLNYAGYVCEDAATAHLSQKNEFDVVSVKLSRHLNN